MKEIKLSRKLLNYLLPGVMTCITVFFGACNKVDKLTQFDMDYQATVVVPSTAGLNFPIELITPEIESNAESEFSVNDTRKDLIEDIRLKSMDLSIVSPLDGDFSFLNSIEIAISAEGLPDKAIAWKEDISSDAGSTLSLEVADVDVKEYIKKDKFQLRVTTVTDELIAKDHEIEVNSVFHVDAKILGI